MSVVPLAQNAIWSPGDEFWFVPNLKDSLWTQKMDWYLNQQMSWAENRKPKPLPEVVRSHLNFEPFEWSSEQTKKSPLFVVADGFLPTTAVIQMPSIKSGTDWALAVKQKWKELGQPPIRVFLPSQLKLAEFSKSWGNDTKVKVSVVSSLENE